MKYVSSDSEGQYDAAQHAVLWGLEELPAADTCCGFGGTFAVKNPDVSAAMLSDKVANVERSGAAIVTAGDASCLMHLAGGLTRAGSAVRTVHLAEILASTA